MIPVWQMLWNGLPPLPSATSTSYRLEVEGHPRAEETEGRRGEEAVPKVTLPGSSVSPRLLPISKPIFMKGPLLPNSSSRQVATVLFKLSLGLVKQSEIRANSHPVFSLRVAYN